MGEVVSEESSSLGPTTQPELSYSNVGYAILAAAIEEMFGGQASPRFVTRAAPWTMMAGSDAASRRSNSLNLGRGPAGELAVVARLACSSFGDAGCSLLQLASGVVALR